MNLILIFESDFISSHHVRITDRRFFHAKEVLKVKLGQSLSVGRMNGLMGKGWVISLTDKAMELDVQLSQQPPKSLPLILILALPRPQMFKRTLLCAASLGIKKIIFLNFNRIEKSLWNSSVLGPEAIKEQLVLGLEQAKDTILPEVILKKRFKPFVEDELPLLIKNKKACLAHPGEVHSLSKVGKEGVVLIIGPEGGLVDFEVDLLKSKGFQAVSLGERILRFENVIPYAVGKMF